MESGTDGATFNCRSENHVSAAAATRQKGSPAHAGGDTFPDWLQRCAEGLIDEPLPSNQLEATPRSGSELRNVQDDQNESYGCYNHSHQKVWRSYHSGSKCSERLQHRCAVVVQGFYSYLIQSYPTMNKSAGDTKSCDSFMPSSDRLGRLYIDISLECIRACEDLIWTHEKQNTG